VFVNELFIYEFYLLSTIFFRGDNNENESNFQSVMGVGQTMVQMGAHQRTLTDATNRASRAHMSRNSASGVNVDQQFGSSQSDQSWKAAKTIEEADMQTGLIAGDCRGENSDDKYRKQMGQNRDGYMKENLVPNSMCGDYHPTLK
jgi:hypothetical protein